MYGIYISAARSRPSYIVDILVYNIFIYDGSHGVRMVKRVRV